MHVNDITILQGGRESQLVKRLATGCTVRGPNPGGIRSVPSKPVLGPTQPPVQWYPIFSGSGVEGGEVKRPGRSSDHQSSSSVLCLHKLVMGWPLPFS